MVGQSDISSISVKSVFFPGEKNAQYSRNERLMQKIENKEAKQYMKKYCKKWIFETISKTTIEISSKKIK